MPEVASTVTIEAPAQDRLHTVSQVRERLGYKTRQGVYELIELGRLKAKKYGGRYRIRESAIAEYIEQYVAPDALPLPEPEVVR